MSVEHWERLYATKSHREMSWYAERLSLSLELIGQLGLPKTAAFIDVGGGASSFADDMLEAGYREITVIDLSETALQVSQKRLMEKAERVRWIAGDVVSADLGGEFDLWHDRAVFHFLTGEEQRLAYRAKVEAHVKPGGFLVLSEFAEDGPAKCSGLPVKRHGEKELAEFFGEGYARVFAGRSIHITPGRSIQKFINLALRRVKA